MAVSPQGRVTTSTTSTAAIEVDIDLTKVTTISQLRLLMNQILFHYQSGAELKP